MIVITAPTGAIGHQVLANLLDSSEPIRVIVRDPSRLPSQIGVPNPATITSDAQLWTALCGLVPRFVMFLLSVLTVGIFWNAQQVQLSSVVRADREYAWFSLAYLAAAATMPFSTALLGEFITLRLALAIYWLNLFVFGMVMLMSWRYLRRTGLLHKDANVIATNTSRRILVAQLMYLLGALLAFVSTYVSIAFIVLVQVYFAVLVDSRLLLLLRHAAPRRRRGPR